MRSGPCHIGQAIRALVIPVLTAALVLACITPSAVKRDVNVFQRYGDYRMAYVIIQPYLPENPIILEGGAGAGWDTRLMAEIWPRGAVHTFEPEPRLAEELKRNTAKHQNVHVYQLALSDTVGKATFHVSDWKEQPSGAGSLLPPTAETLERFPELTFPRTIEVSTTTIDKWAEANGIERVDFIWLDIQGFELPALKGASRILRSTKVLVIEVEFAELYRGQALWPELKSWLEENGFDLIAADFDPRFPQESRAQQCDVRSKVYKATNDWCDSSYGNAVFVRR